MHLNAENNVDRRLVNEAYHPGGIFWECPTGKSQQNIICLTLGGCYYPPIMYHQIIQNTHLTNEIQYSHIVEAHASYTNIAFDSLNSEWIFTTFTRFRFLCTYYDKNISAKEYSTAHPYKSSWHDKLFVSSWWLQPFISDICIPSTIAYDQGVEWWTRMPGMIYFV